MLQFALALLKGSALPRPMLKPDTHASRSHNKNLLLLHLQVSRAEYLLLLATFLSILQLELEKGVAAGILLCTLYFAVTYARVSASWTELPRSWA